MINTKGILLKKKEKKNKVYLHIISTQFLFETFVILSIFSKIFVIWNVWNNLYIVRQRGNNFVFSHRVRYYQSSTINRRSSAVLEICCIVIFLCADDSLHRRWIGTKSLHALKFIQFSEKKQWRNLSRYSTRRVGRIARHMYLREIAISIDVRELFSNQYLICYLNEYLICYLNFLFQVKQLIYSKQFVVIRFLF